MIPAMDKKRPQPAELSKNAKDNDTAANAIRKHAAQKRREDVNQAAVRSAREAVNRKKAQ